MVTQAEPKPLEKPGGVLGTVHGTVKVEIVLADFETHLFLDVHGQLVIEERDRCVTRTGRGGCWLTRFGNLCWSGYGMPSEEGGKKQGGDV